MLITSTSYPKSCKGKVAARFPGWRLKLSQSFLLEVIETLTDITRDNMRLYRQKSIFVEKRLRPFDLRCCKSWHGGCLVSRRYGCGPGQAIIQKELLSRSCSVSSLYCYAEEFCCRYAVCSSCICLTQSIQNHLSMERVDSDSFDSESGFGPRRPGNKKAYVRSPKPMQCGSCSSSFRLPGCCSAACSACGPWQAWRRVLPDSLWPIGSRAAAAIRWLRQSRGGC